MKSKKLIYIYEEEKIIPCFGVFKSGDEADFSEELLSTGFFNLKQSKSSKKDGED